MRLNIILYFMAAAVLPKDFQVDAIVNARGLLRRLRGKVNGQTAPGISMPPLAKPSSGNHHPENIMANSSEPKHYAETHKDIENLFKQNLEYVKMKTDKDPLFFQKLGATHKPKYLWIGCSDSRVPANEIVDLAPGELFVHRNIANVVVHTDMNCLSVLQYAIEVLHVEHILVVGHYGCGGVARTLQGGMEGVADNWLRHVQDVQWKRRSLLEGKVFGDQVDLLCELNVLEQVSHVCRTTFVRDAWARGEKLVVHGWCYGIKDGLANDLGWSVDGPCDLGVALQSAVDACMQRWNKEA